MRRIIIKASDVAACIGQNRFKPAEEVLNDMWKRYSPETFVGQTRREAEDESLSKCAAAQSIVADAVAVRAKSSDEAEATLAKAQAEIAKITSLSDEDRQNVLDLLKSKIRTTHGTRSESKTADKVAAEEGAVLHTDNAFHEFEVCQLDNKTRYVIVGKIDRVEYLPDGSKVLVEIKNRTRKLFRAVYPSENIQIQTYLKMLDLDRAKLIEQFNNETNTMIVERDDDFWEDVILPGMVEFCRELNRKL
jgi:hypothetical protein